MARILVTGKYVDPSTYVLYLENGEIYRTLEESIPLKIADEVWCPIKLKNSLGTGTILMCKKWDKNGNEIDEFPLIHNKKGLWAINQASAKRGIFHKYTPID